MTARDAWARATVPGADTGALYVTLRAQGGPDRLVGVDTAVAGMAMLHVSAEQGGVMTMRDLDSVELPANTPRHAAAGRDPRHVDGARAPAARGRPV